MATIFEELETAFVAYGVKSVSKTDVVKKAYLPNEDQRNALLEGGYSPGVEDAPTIVPILDPETGTVYETTYYDSLREGSGREPETRMGRGLLRFISQGDRLMLATDGVTVFARKLVLGDRVAKPIEEIEKAVEKVYQQLDPKQLLERAKRAAAKPTRTPMTVDQFVRDPAVKALVIRRCEGKCEVPGCGWTGFTKDDGTPFIEVHHVKFLGEGGDDTIWNTAGVCPICHRLAHYGPARPAFAASLLAEVARRTTAFEASL